MEKPASWDLPSDARNGAVAGPVATLSQRSATAAWLSLVFVLAFLSAPMSVMAQGVQYTANKMENTRRANVRVDPTTLALSLSIPIAEYPQRGGGSLPITYNYSSRVWRIESQGPIGEDCASIHPELNQQLRAIYDEGGGWSSSLNPPSITNMVGSSQPYFSYGDPYDQLQCTSVPCPQYFVARRQVRMPDGSIHELRYTDTPTQTGVANVVYYAVDGSGLKYDSASYTLFLSDGSRYILGSYQQPDGPWYPWPGTPTTFIDRNGNTSTYTPGTTYATDGYWTDSLGRTIGYTTIPGVGGTTQTITSRSYPISQLMSSPSFQFGDYFDVCDTSYGPYEPVVLGEIELPNGTKYQFKYNDHGEVDKIIYPTGGYERLRYEEVQTANFYGSPYSKTNRGVVERWVSPSGSGLDEEHWQYATPSATLRVMTAPDNTRTETVVFPDAYYGAPIPFGYDDPRVGLPIEERTYSATNQMLHRKLMSWDVTGSNATGNSFAAIAKRNPRLIKVVDIILDPGGTALTKTNTLEYDTTDEFTTGVRQTATNEYGYVALGQGSAETLPIGSMSQGTLLRRTEKTYLDANNQAYRDRNILGLLTSVTVYKGVSGPANVVAQSSISYDEYSLTSIGSVASWTDPQTPYRGNATTTGRWLNTTGAYLQTHAYYDQFGNVRTAVDAMGKQSQLDYSSTYQYAYPTTATTAVPDPSGQYGSTTAFSTMTNYDFNTGLVLSTTDANGKTTGFDYTDPLNRIKTITRPDGGSTTYIYNDTPGNLYVETLTKLDSTRNIDTYQYFDGIGRSVRAFLYDGTPSNPWIVTDKYYDNLGRVSKVSSPYRVTSLSATVPASCSECTTTTYDALSRVHLVTTADNAQVVTDYSASTSGTLGPVTTVTDQAGRKRRSLTDALGRLVRVDEPDKDTGSLGDVSTPVQPTSYDYDVLDNLLHVNQSPQPQRSFSYDSLSRLSSAYNPESGTVSYQYDNNGNLTQKTDGRGTVTTYVYDALNRVKIILYRINGQPDPNTGDVEYLYDNATNGKGRLWLTYKWGAKPSHTAVGSYDAIGRITQLHNLFGDGQGGWLPAYTINRNYTLTGNVTSQTYPSGHAVTYNYDAAGRLADKDSQNLAFTGSLGDGTNRTYASNITYSPFGGLAQEKFGTATALYHKRHYNIRGQLYDTRVSTLSLQANEFDWNRGCLALYYGGAPWGQSSTSNNGNVTMQQHWVPADDSYSNYLYTQQSYSYDSLNRLSSVSELHGTPAGQSATDYAQVYSYDRYGNRTIDGSLTWGTGINNKQFTVDANTNRLGVPSGQTGTMHYDAAGNLDNDTYTGAGNRTYDAENRITQAWGGNNQWQYYTYNANGQRVRRKVDNVETWQIYGIDGELLAEYPASGAASSPQKEYGYRNGQLLVTAASGGIHWLVTDQLDTPRMVFDQTGSLAGVERHDYLPFGEELFAGVGARTTGQGYSSNDGVRQQFTSKERDVETGLDYFLARYYSSEQGRFTRPDPSSVSAQPLQPQSWNRYTYCLNNPLRFVDPSGLVWAVNKAGYPWTFHWYKKESEIVAPWEKVDSDYQIGSDVNGNYVALWLDPNSDKFKWLTKEEYNQVIADEVTQHPVRVILSMFTKKENRELLFAVTPLFGGVGGAGPVKQGAAGVEKMTAEILAEGGEILGSEITMDTAVARTRPDLLFRTAEGELMFGEAKNGLWARLTKNQSKAFPELESVGGIPRGANALLIEELRPCVQEGTAIGPIAVRLFQYKP